MTKAEAIKATGYTERELIYLGLIVMKNRMKQAREENPASFDHYDRLVKAYDKMMVECKAELVKEGLA